jgi:hypothetical protein
VPAQYIAIWDGTDWCGLGSTFDNVITSVGFFKDTLYVGGGFRVVDGDTVNRIAKWIGGNYVDTCGNMTGINENILDKNSVSVFPNPTAGKFQIQINNLQLVNGEIEIYDLLGNIIYTSPLHSPNQEMDISPFQSGIYFLKTKMKEGTITKKIVKQ